MAKIDEGRLSQNRAVPAGAGGGSAHFRHSFETLSSPCLAPDTAVADAARRSGSLGAR
jgi:hypothetical protein